MNAVTADDPPRADTHIATKEPLERSLRHVEFVFQMGALCQRSIGSDAFDDAVNQGNRIVPNRTATAKKLLGPTVAAVFDDTCGNFIQLNQV